MGKFVKGEIIVVPFPFSDLSSTKKRPALVIASLMGDDLILCQITSKTISDPYGISISDSDFVNGGLRQQSNVRPNRIFTADSNIALYSVGMLSSSAVRQVVTKIVEIITADRN